MFFYLDLQTILCNVENFRWFILEDFCEFDLKAKQKKVLFCFGFMGAYYSRLSACNQRVPDQCVSFWLGRTPTCINQIKQNQKIFWRFWGSYICRRDNINIISTFFNFLIALSKDLCPKSWREFQWKLRITQICPSNGMQPEFRFYPVRLDKFYMTPLSYTQPLCRPPTA